MANIRTVRRSGRVFRGGKSRRETMWIGVATTENTLGGAPTAVLANSLNAAALALRPFTIVRVRGMIYVRSDQTAANQTYGVSLGYAVVSAQAEAIGITALPTPLTDHGSDLFFVYEQLFGGMQIGSGAGTGVPVHIGAFKDFDSRAMRKVNDDQDLVVVQENEIAGLVVTHSARLLIKLH